MIRTSVHRYDLLRHTSYKGVSLHLIRKFGRQLVNALVFLSHCGWGGVSDSVLAGVPVLGYPGMQDQSPPSSERIREREILRGTVCLMFDVAFHNFPFSFILSVTFEHMIKKSFRTA